MYEFHTNIQHIQRLCTPPPDICIVKEFLFSQLKLPYSASIIVR